MKNKILQFFQSIEPHFKKGGKLEKFYQAYQAFYTFLFTPGEVTHEAPHIRDKVDLKRTMTAVIIALIPCTLFGIWNVGHQHYLALGQYTGIKEAFLLKFAFGLKVFLPLFIASYVTGLTIEFIFSVVRNHPVSEGYLVTGLLIPLVLPPTIPIWMVVVSIAFGIIFGKEVFGGTGYNVLNPALFVRAVLFFGYPKYMTGDIWIAADGVSGATPIGQIKTGAITYHQIDALKAFLGFIPGSIGETSTLLCLLSGILLVIWGVASWRIIISAIIGTALTGILLNSIGRNAIMQMPFWYHYIIGGYAFGIVFMATDPVSSAKTPLGKIIYGFLIGVLIPLLRAINPAYPEVTMLVILFMNAFSSVIDLAILASIKAKRKARWKNAKQPKPLLQITHHEV